MTLLHKFQCWFFGHDWHNDHAYPVHGYYDMPNDGSYCERCKVTA